MVFYSRIKANVSEYFLRMKISKRKIISWFKVFQLESILSCKKRNIVIVIMIRIFENLLSKDQITIEIRQLFRELTTIDILKRFPFAERFVSFSFQEESKKR